MFDYFYGQSGEMFSYFRVPKILFRDIKFKDLSTDAKTLYGILVDRMGLSVKKLNADHIRFVLDSLAENTAPVRNVKQYLLAMLYNAPTTMNLYYQNKTNHDFARGSPGR